MTDLVERLRDDGNSLALEAADEIERLRRLWIDGVNRLLAQVTENKEKIDDATGRLDRAGL